MKYEKGSFITVPNQLLLVGLDPKIQCLFMWLCFHANQDGECFPSRRLLAKETGMSIDSVKRGIKDLEGTGIIRATRRKNGVENMTNLYEIIIGGVGADSTQVGAETTQGVGADSTGELNPIITQSNNYSADAGKVPLKPLKGKMKINPLNQAHNTLRPLVIKALEPLHPLEAKRWYANTTEGKAVDALIDWLGEKKLMRFASIWPAAVKEAFAPQAYKPSAILAKWPQIEKFLIERKKNGSGQVSGEATMGKIAEMIN